MTELLIFGLVFFAVALGVYAAFQLLSVPMKQRLELEYQSIDTQLKGIFYTSYDARVFLWLKYAGSLVALAIGVVLFRSFVFGAFMAAIVFVVPSILLRRTLRQRFEKLEEQTSDVMTALSATVKAGMTLEESIAEIAENMRPPVSQEFALIKQRIDSGKTIPAALKEADRRLQAPRLGLIFRSLIVSQERGGKLAALMDNLSDSMREIQRVEERIKTETSGLRLSSTIMVFMPLLIGIFLYIADPEQVTMLFTTAIGNLILVIAIAMDIAAFRMMQKIVDLDV